MSNEITPSLKKLASQSFNGFEWLTPANLNRVLSYYDEDFKVVDYARSKVVIRRVSDGAVGRLSSNDWTAAAMRECLFFK